MKIIKDHTGTFPCRLWFEDGEIEKIAERHREDFISPIGQTKSLVMDVDKFVEIYLPDAFTLLLCISFVESRKFWAGAGGHTDPLPLLT